MIKQNSLSNGYLANKRHSVMFGDIIYKKQLFWTQVFIFYLDCMMLKVSNSKTLKSNFHESFFIYVGA